jgi:hypothetical protein
MFGGRLTRLFAIKCLLIEYPLVVLGLVYISSAVFLAYILRILEYANDLSSETSMSQFKYLGDTLWFIFVTYATIGYGDYYPKTNLGRVFSIIAAVLGTYLASVIIVSLQLKLELHPTETNVTLDNY